MVSMNLSGLKRKLLRNSQIRPEIRIESYQDELLVNYLIKKSRVHLSQLEKTKNIGPNDLLILGLPGLCQLKPKSVILDFGGGAGVHYRTFKRIYPSIDVVWLIVETTQMVKLAHIQGNHQPKYYESVESAFIDYPKIDVIYANSSLQYTEEPLNTLANLIALNPKHFFLVRTPMSQTISFKTKQKSLLKHNGPGSLDEDIDNIEVSYPVSIQTESDYFQMFGQIYEFIFRISDGVLRNLEGPQESCPIVTVYFRKLG